MSIIIFIVILLVLVLVHEFGHFIVAKKSGIRVDEFAFGFPPKIFSIKKGETKYSFNAVPFGGYVKIFGENPDEESMTGPDSSRSFVNKPRYVQAAVLFAGVFFNILLAWIIFSVGFMTGFPTDVAGAPAGLSVNNPELIVTSVLKNSPAEKAGLASGDKIVSLSAEDGNRVAQPSPETLKNFVSNHEGRPISFEILHGKTQESVTITPVKISETGAPAVGISMGMIGTLEKLPVPKALWYGLKFTWDNLEGIVKGFRDLITGANGTVSLSDVSGPVGIVVIIGSIAKFGFGFILSFTALISLNLAVINLIPFPALDGGRLLFLLIEKIKGSRINPKVANMANAIGFALLILLMIVVTYHDIIKLI